MGDEMGEEMAISPQQGRASDGGDGELLGAGAVSRSPYLRLLTFNVSRGLGRRFRWRWMLFGCEFSHD